MDGGIYRRRRKSAVICADKIELLSFLEKNNQKFKKKVAIVAQTTYNINTWDNCAHIVNELKSESLSGASRGKTVNIGITAGFSTPAYIIKEV